MDERALFEGIKRGNFSDFIELVRAHQTPLYAYLLATQVESQFTESHFTSLFSSLLSRILKSRKPFPLKEWLFNQAHLKAKAAVTVSMSDDADIEARLQNLTLPELELFFLKIQLGFSFGECEAILLQPAAKLKNTFDQSFSHLYPDLNFAAASTPECTKFTASLVDYLCRTLPAIERDLMAKHTQYCSDCSSRLGRLAPFFRAIESFGPPAPPANLSINLNEKTRNLYDIYLFRLKNTIKRRKILFPVYILLFIILIVSVYRPIMSFFASYFSTKDKVPHVSSTTIYTTSNPPTSEGGLSPSQDKTFTDYNYTTTISVPIEAIIAPKKDKLALPQSPEFENLAPQPGLDASSPLEQPKGDSKPSPASLNQPQPSPAITGNVAHDIASIPNDNLEPLEDVPSVADTTDTNEDSQEKHTDTEVAPVLPVDGSNKDKSLALPEKGCPINCKIDDESSEIIQTLNEIMKIHNDAVRVTTDLSPNSPEVTALEPNMAYNIKISESLMMGMWFRTYIDLKARLKEWEEQELVEGASIGELDFENTPSDILTYNNYLHYLQLDTDTLNNTNLFALSKRLSIFTLTDPLLNTSVSFEIYEANSSDILPMDVQQDPSCQP